ncbi:hypothetical protein CKO32_17840 [Afifella marina DSM 2698]|nr:hypothetical protein [Afifella marina DSM 2698]MBK1629041.1 hypothetical protein [Afifella marina]MBK5918017.1 hypothetical protein [Afifella marina]RAI17555.1 hypothetical protein CH311_17915 [Afifella marina DSM 2698]
MMIMSGLFDDIGTYISEMKERAGRQSRTGGQSYTWKQCDLYPASGGMKEICISFSRNIRDISDSEMCVFRLARQHLSDQLGERGLYDISKAICLRGRPLIEFVEDDDGWIVEAEVDEQTRARLETRAREIFYASDRQEREQEWRDLIERLLRYAETRFGATEVGRIRNTWLQT